MDISTGIVTTVAGTGEAADSGDGGPADQAGVSQPTGITVDAAGDLYFSSSWSRVRRVIVRTGIIETVAGLMMEDTGSQAWTERFAYQYDDYGNWIERTT